MVSIGAQILPLTKFWNTWPCLTTNNQKGNLIILTSLNPISSYQSSARDFAQTQTSLENLGHLYSNQNLIFFICWMSICNKINMINWGDISDHSPLYFFLHETLGDSLYFFFFWISLQLVRNVQGTVKLRFATP